MAILHSESKGYRKYVTIVLVSCDVLAIVLEVPIGMWIYFLVNTRASF